MGEAATIKIENGRDSLVVLPPAKAKGGSFAAVRLLPGINVVPKAYYEAIKERVDIKAMFGPAGILKIAKGGTPILPADSKDTLASLGEGEAIALVHGCDGLDQLQRWASKEKRKAVLDALVAQIAAVEAAGKQEGGDVAA